MLSQRENLLHFPAWLGWVDNNVSVATGWMAQWVSGTSAVVCGSPGNHFSVTVMYEHLRDHKVFGYSNIKSLCDQLICAYVQYNTTPLTHQRLRCEMSLCTFGASSLHEHSTFLTARELRRLLHTKIAAIAWAKVRVLS